MTSDLDTAKGATAATAPAARPGGSRPARRLLVVLCAVAALLLVAAAVLAWQVRGHQAREDERAAALRAASQSALNLTSIDNAEFDEDVRRVLDGATGAFRSDFEGRSAQLKELLTKNEVVSSGRVIETALVRFDPRSATALVVVDSNVRNTAAPEGRVNTYRMRLQLEQRGGTWRTSMLEFVG